MPLLRDGLIIEDDAWTRFTDEQELLSDQADYAIISFNRFMQRAQDGETLPDGVSVGPADDVNALAPFAQQLRLICIEFPIYTDGRGYSHARLLRKRLGFRGELRAVGDIREDQILFMLRVEIDSFDCNAVPDTQLLEKLVSHYKYNYQPSYKLPLAG